MNAAMILEPLLLPLIAGWAWSRVLPPGPLSRDDLFATCWLTGALSGAVTGALAHEWLWLWGGSVSALAAIAMWWFRRTRKRRRRALEALGYKAKAARDALVRRAREAAKPRPVLRPVPGGAR